MKVTNKQKFNLSNLGFGWQRGDIFSLEFMSKDFGPFEAEAAVTDIDEHQVLVRIQVKWYLLLLFSVSSDGSYQLIRNYDEFYGDKWIDEPDKFMEKFAKLFTEGK